MKIEKKAVKYLIGLTMILGNGTFILKSSDPFLTTELPAFILGGLTIIVGLISMYSLWNWNRKKGYGLCLIGIGLGLSPFIHELTAMKANQVQGTWFEDKVINQEIMDSLTELEGLTINELIEHQDDLIDKEVRVKGIVNETQINTSRERSSYLLLNPTNISQEDESLEDIQVFTNNQTIREARSNYRAVSVVGVLKEEEGHLIIEGGRVEAYSTIGSRRWCNNNKCE